MPSFLAIAIHILSEERYFLRSLCDDFADFRKDVGLGPGYLPSAGMRDDAVTTEVIASRLDDDIGRTRIFLRLLETEVFIKFFIISDRFPGYNRQDLGDVSDFFNPDDEINDIGNPKDFIITIK